MTLDDMRMLLTVARTGNLTAAARALYISQPALSKRLSRFEQEIGAKLFDRSKGAHRLTLTPAGQLLIPFAENWNDLQQEIGMLHDINSRVHFFVETVGDFGECVLADALLQFHQENPEVELVAQQNHSRDCYGSLHDRIANIAFVTQEHYFQNIVTTPLFQEQMQLLASASAGYSGTVDARSLPWEKEIVIAWNSEYMRWRQKALQFSRHPNVTTWSVSLSIPFLRKENCWVMAPRTIADAALVQCPDLVCLPLSDPPPSRTVFWAEEYGRHHDASDLLLEILRRRLKGREGIRWL